MTRKYTIPNELLKFERERRNWKLEDVSGRIGVVDYGLVGKWERGDASPGHQFRQKICEVFGKTAKELWLDKEDNPYWFMPHHRNDLFTGREELLGDIHKKFAASGSASTVFPLAIRGLAGIGKTQTAIEYAYRYRQEYHTVLWVRAHSPELLATDFAKIATVLKLPENTEKDQMLVIDAVKNWLSRFTYWLLLLDNVEDMSSVSDFLPSTKKGHILLTTRSQATMPIAKPIDLDRMKPEEGTLFLLRRTGFIPQNGTLDDVSHANRTKATKVANVMDGLPLALDQVGAYIEETKCGLLNYLSLYDKKKGALLKWRGAVTKEHPESVYSTFLLSFTAVEKSSSIASDLLRVLAFLASDDIPEEIITGGAPDLGPTLQALADPYTFDTSIEILSRYSLIQRNADMKRLSIHRLVQEVLKEGMEEDIQKQWIERIVRAVNRVFPDVEFATWPECQRYLPHALICANLIERWEIAFPEAARLLDQLGLYLKELAHYQQAEPLLQRALVIREHTLGIDHPSTATSFDNLAELYHEQGQYLRAEPLLQRALVIRERVLGVEHPSTATSLNNLARLFHDQRHYSKAEPLFLRSLTIYENILGSENAFTATCLNNLAGLYLEQGEYRKAEPLLRRALAIQENRLGKEHPQMASTLNNLAGLYLDEGNNEQAERLYKQALSIRERMLGPDHPSTAISLNNLAKLYYRQGLFQEAENLLKQSLSIYERILGPNHPSTADSLGNLAEFYLDQGLFLQAEPLFQRALSALEKSVGSNHPKFFMVMENYQICFRRQSEMRHQQNEKPKD